MKRLREAFVIRCESSNDFVRDLCYIRCMLEQAQDLPTGLRDRMLESALSNLSTSKDSLNQAKQLLERK